MKKIFLLLILLSTILIVSTVKAERSDKEIIFDDLNTKNFIAKAGYLELHSIKKICSYDYCDYLNGNNVYDVLDNFKKNYLKTVKNKEDRLILNVKGIKITRLILEN